MADFSSNIETSSLNQDLIIFGKNIAGIRTEKNLSLSAMSKEIKYNRKLLSKLELGTQHIKYQQALEIARCLNISFPLLFSSEISNITEPYTESDYLSVYIKNVKVSMISDNITAMSIVEQVKISNGTISRILHGIEANPNLLTLSKIASVLNLKLEYMFSHTV